MGIQAGRDISSSNSDLARRSIRFSGTVETTSGTMRIENRPGAYMCMRPASASTITSYPAAFRKGPVWPYPVHDGLGALGKTDATGKAYAQNQGKYTYQ